MNESKALIGREAICSYLHIGKDKFYELAKTKLPMVRTSLGWLSHKDLLDEFLTKELESVLKKK